MMMRLSLAKNVSVLCLLAVSSCPVLAYQAAQPNIQGNAATYVEVAFTPGQDAAGLIIAAINKARTQILVQAFSFTHDDIAHALVAAHHRGVDVKLIADREQTKIMRRGQVPAIAAAGVPVWFDGEHLSAHNKVMIIDAGTKQSAVITGSYNFTKAAQYRNAENVLIVHGNQALAAAYRVNWQQHLPHAQAFGVNDSNHSNHK